MEFRQLRYFCMVAELRSLTAAAERLNVTQPAVGMQIRKLEESLDLQLMQRHSRGIRLTPAGKIMLEHARMILERIEQTRRALSRVRNDDVAEIRIGVTPSLSMVFVPRLMELCHDRFPGISLIFTQGFPNALLARFERGTLDFCFTTKDIETENAESVPLILEEIKLIGAAPHIHALPEPCPPELLEHLPLVLPGRHSDLCALLSRELQRRSMKMNNMIEVSAIPLRRSYVTRQARFCMAPAALFHSEIMAGICATRSLEVPGLKRCLQLAGPRVEAMTAAQSSVRTLVIKIIEKMIVEGSYEWQLPGERRHDISTAFGSQQV